MQSTWAIGEMVAAGVVALVLPSLGWRAVFFVGVLPALIVFWIRRDVPESEIWLRRQAAPARAAAAGHAVAEDVRRNALVATAMNACAMFGYWGLFTWIPAYLSLPVAEGGRGLCLMKTTTWLIAMGIGEVARVRPLRFLRGRGGAPAELRRATSSPPPSLVPLYGVTRDPVWLLVLGPLVAFFGTGFFSGFSAIASELFPTEIRATAMGLTYNLGRGLSAVAPAVIGLLATRFRLRRGVHAAGRPRSWPRPCSRCSCPKQGPARSNSRRRLRRIIGRSQTRRIVSRA